MGLSLSERVCNGLPDFVTGCAFYDVSQSYNKLRVGCGFQQKKTRTRTVRVESEESVLAARQ
jgi:hypothetical protein